MKLFRSKAPAGKVVPVVSLKGIIMSGGRSPFSGGGPTLNIDHIKGELTRAFNTAGAVAVALDINSPGGSPTQSELIGEMVRRLSEEKKIPVIAFTQDLAASGGYWLACAADEIYAAKTSTIGSIGVVSSSYGAPDLFKKLGVEERTFTAGKSKRRMLMSEPVKEEDREWMRGKLEEIHAMFKDWVKERRGNRLVVPAGQDRTQYLDDNVFTGDVWSGVKAKKMGLVDGIGYLEPKMREKFGADVKFDYLAPPRKGMFDLVKQFMGVSTPIQSMPQMTAAAAVAAATEVLRAEAAWGPYDMR